MVHIKERLWKAGSGGFLVTGEGGDEVFGNRRVTPITQLLYQQTPSRRRALRVAVLNLAPRPVRRRRDATSVLANVTVPWLTPAARTALQDVVVSDSLAQPLPWNRSIVNLLQRRGATIGAHTIAVAAAAFNTTLIDPLLDPSFVRAWAAFGGRLGFPGRSAATRALFGHLLPEAVITREDKPLFFRVVFSEPSKRFAASWNGEGIDTALVVGERLKRVWEREQPSILSAPLLQAAWLHANGLSE